MSDTAAESQSPVSWAVKPWHRQWRIEAVARVDTNQIAVADDAILRVPERNSAIARWQLVGALVSDPELWRRFEGLNLCTTKFPFGATDSRFAMVLSQRHGIAWSAVREIYFTVTTNYIACLTERRQIEGWGIYPVMSRANHSCDPNTELHGSGLGKMVLRSVRPIEPGEPITWDYATPKSVSNMSRAERRAFLRNCYRFSCECDMCAVRR